MWEFRNYIGNAVNVDIWVLYQQFDTLSMIKASGADQSCPTILEVVETVMNDRLSESPLENLQYYWH